MPVMLEERKNAEIELRNVRLEIVSSRRQRTQMLVALAILVVAIILLVVKDWQVVNSWFSSPAPKIESEQLEHSVVAVTPAPSANTSESRIAKQGPTVAPTKGQESTPPVVVTSRAVLPPLEVEVVAGGHHRTVQSASNSIKVDMQSEAESAPAESSVPQSNTTTAAVDNGVVNATESVHLSQDTLQAVSRPVQPNYPLLAKQMKVQGSVILQALIGKNGSIENLQVLSGPAILSSAAMEAVRQWHFRPYFVDGQTTETQARITVNFTISTY
jgi:TonB family protein